MARVEIERRGRIAGHATIILVVMIAALASRAGGLSRYAPPPMMVETPISGLVTPVDLPQSVTRKAMPETLIATGPRDDNAHLTFASHIALTETQVAPMLPVPERTWPALPLARDTRPPSNYVAAGGNFNGAGWVNVRRCIAAPVRKLGAGSFRRPTLVLFVSGFTFTPEHLGVDLGGKLGDPIFAADGGTVVWAGVNPDTPNYGLVVVVDHGDGWQTLYAHLNSVFVSCGQEILKGTVLGALGTTGRSSGPHLHFEVWHDGEMVNPMNVVQ